MQTDPAQGKESQSPVRRVLVVRVGHLGDSVMATTVIEPLRQACGGGVQIDFAAGPGASTAILRMDRRIHCVFPIERRRLHWRLNSTKRVLRNHAREAPYDLVVNLECGPECDDFARFLSYRRFCGRPFANPRHDLSVHCIDTEKTIYRDQLGAAVTQAEPAIRLCEVSVREDAAGERFVLLNPGFADLARSDYRGHRRWPTGHWLELIEGITSVNGWSAVVNGTEAERPLLEPLLRQPRVKSGVGTGIEALVDTVRSAACVVSVDTGTMHLAAALGTPVLALFGPTLPKLTGPYSRSTRCRVLTSGIDCQPCDRTPAHKRCKANRCMSELQPQTVVTALWELLADARADALASPGARA